MHAGVDILNLKKMEFAYLIHKWYKWKEKRHKVKFKFSNLILKILNEIFFFF
jgi:hypothetical protein